jgi:flavorubredoxin
MVTFLPEAKLLLSNDAFGQHLASSNRFDDEVDPAVLMQEAKKYYANIVMHLWGPIDRALQALKGLEVEMIAPSHGVVWRSRPDLILETYKRWVAGVSEPRVVIVYDTMWGSTEQVANALVEGIMRENVEVNLYRLGTSDTTEIIADILDAKAVLVGSPTLNNGLFPTVASFLTYLKGLKPRGKLGAFFGSYGWGGGAKSQVETELKSAGVDLLESHLDFNFKPNERELKTAYDFGREIARQVA